MKGKYPTLIIDNEKIKKMRREIQKPWEKESFWPWIFLRRFSIYISKFLSDKTSISPNMITIIGILLGFITGGLFLVPNHNIHMLGILFYQFVYLADCVDGEVARITERTSNIGHWLDSGLRYTLYTAQFSLTYTILDMYSVKHTNIILFILINTILLSILSTDNVRLDVKDNINIIKKNSFLVDFLVFLFATDPGIYLIYFIIIILGFKNLVIYLIIYHTSIFVFKTIFRFKSVIRSF